MRPLTGILFYLEGQSMGEERHYQIKDIIKANEGDITKKKGEADYVVVDPRNVRHESRRNISYQGVYHLIGTYGAGQIATLSQDFTKPYLEHKLLLQMVEHRMKENLMGLIEFNGDRDLQNRKYYLDDKIGKRSKKYQLLKTLGLLLEKTTMEEVRKEEEAQLVFTTEIREDSYSRKAVRSEKRVFVSPAWMFDSLFIGKCLPFGDYSMVQEQLEEEEEKEEIKSNRESSQKERKSQLADSSEEEKETPEDVNQGRRDPSEAEYFIELEDEEEEDKVRRRIVRLKGYFALSKSLSTYIICRHGAISDEQYEWRVEAEEDQVRYLTPEYLDYCLAEGQWILPTGSDLCHIRALPCKLPVQYSGNVEVYISGVGLIPGTKEALVKVLEILGLSVTKTIKKATHFIPLSATDKLAKLVLKIDRGREVPFIVSPKWVEYVANKGKLPESNEEFAVKEKMIERARASLSD